MWPSKSSLFILFMGFSRQEYWSGLPFPSPVDHVLSEFSTMTRPSWVALNNMAHSFIELDKAVAHVIRLVSFLWLWFSVCLPFDGEGYEAYGSFLMGETDCGGNWILFWWVGPCSVNLQSNFLLMGGAVSDLLQKEVSLSAPNPAAGLGWPIPPVETPGHSQASLGQPLVRSLLLSPGSWCAQGFACTLQ